MQLETGSESIVINYSACSPDILIKLNSTTLNYLLIMPAWKFWSSL